MRVRLVPCQPDLSPPPRSNFILLIVQRRFVCYDSICFMFLESNFVLLNLMYVFIVLVKFGLLSGRLLGNTCSHSTYDMFSKYKYLIDNSVFSLPRFFDWEFVSDCAFSWSLPSCTFLYLRATTLIGQQSFVRKLHISGKLIVKFAIVYKPEYSIRTIENKK